MKQVCLAIGVAAATAVAAIGFLRGTYAAGGSDSSCYALMADAFASGALQPSSALVERVPWPDAAKTFTPGGFQPSDTRPSSYAPICAPGFSLMIAPLVALGGLDGVFVLSPIAGAVLVWCTFVAARRIAGPAAGAVAAVLIAASPAVLYQVVQPMNDVTTAALWMAAFAALTGRRWVLAGLCCGVALLVRPNLLPLAVVAAIGVLSSGVSMNDRGAVLRFGVAAAPFGLLVLVLNDALYGSPFRTGYGEVKRLFELSRVPANAARYLGWLIETHTVFPLLAIAAPFIVPHDKRREVWLAIALIGITLLLYFMYTPFDDWSYLRFLLPAIALMLVCASSAIVSALARAVAGGPAKAGHYVPRAVDVVSGFSRTAILAVVTAAVAVFCVRAADVRLAFNLQALERRYRSAGHVVRDVLPDGAVVLAVWDSGAVRFHGRKEALAWHELDPAWLDKSLAWLDREGRAPFILLESWEEADFRKRFSGHSDVGKLDWPAKYEIDRVVRIFDPKDRERHERGDRVVTEYLWPLRR